jgi:hypothetical protein
MRSLLISLVALVLPFAAVAETAPAVEKKEFPKSGTLSSSAASGYGSRAVNLPFGGIDVAGTEAAPVSGSISKLGRDQYVARLFNNTKDEPISVSAEIVQVNSSGGRVRADSFSTTLAPGQKYERTVTAAGNVADVQLALRNWKSLKKPKKEEPGTPVAGSTSAKN